MRHHLNHHAIRVRVGALAVAVVLALVFASPVAAQRAAPMPKPHRFGTATPGDNNQFIQVAASSTSGRPDGRQVNGVETKIRHESTILAPGANAGYSFSAGAYTTTGYWLQMGYLVLGTDGGGLARWFVQVLDPTGKTVEWKLSRAGAANPPPACSACSGDAGTGGYPFAFTSDTGGAWTFWFDGITKDRVTLGSANAAIDPTRVYFIGEVTAPSNVSSNVMGPRTALRTLRLWSNAAGSWVEPAGAQVAYANSTGAGAAACPVYGIESAGTLWDSYANAAFHAVRAGSGAACTPAGTALWPNTNPG